MKVKIKAIVDFTACPLCREELHAPKLAVAPCEECGNGMHEACFTEFGRCGAMECTADEAPSTAMWIEVNGDHMLVESALRMGALLEVETAGHGTWILYNEHYAREQVEENLRGDLSDYISDETLLEWARQAIDTSTGVKQQLEEWIDSMASDTAEQSMTVGGDGEAHYGPDLSEAFEEDNGRWEYATRRG